MTLPTRAHATGARETGIEASTVEPASSGEDPRQLYEDGRKAYRLGDFEAAVQKWERAYALSDKPLLLYNISLAYKGRYTITKDISDLRRAKAILDNFIKLAEADPDLDLDDAPERMKELEGLIKQAEEEKASGETPTPPPQVDMEDQLRDMPEGADPGKKYRIAGIASMGAGGGLVLIGSGVGIYFLVKSQDFNTELGNIDAEFQQMNPPCPDEAALPDVPTNPMETDCINLYNRRNTARENGREANVAGYVSVGVLGGIGLVGLVAGAILFTEGNRRSRRWEKGMNARLRVMPTTQGLLIQGRF